MYKGLTFNTFYHYVNSIFIQERTQVVNSFFGIVDL